MTKKQEQKKVEKPKLVEVTFDPKALGASDDATSIYGILVTAKGKKLVGKCDPIVLKALKDAGRCE